jgi:hypothetical protein
LIFKAAALASRLTVNARVLAVSAMTLEQKAAREGAAVVKQWDYLEGLLINQLPAIG